jgi:AmiR/NasT family two-component response regulator
MVRSVDTMAMMFGANSYRELINNADSEGIMAALTKPAVEVAVLERVRLKVRIQRQHPPLAPLP